jgi:hypothetical protein
VTSWGTVRFSRYALLHGVRLYVFGIVITNSSLLISTASSVDGNCEYSLLNTQVRDSRRGVVFNIGFRWRWEPLSAKSNMLRYFFNVHRSVHRNNILVYTRQVATLHSLFYLETAVHVSGGTTTHHQDSKQLYLQHMVFVRPLLLPAAIAAGSSNGLTNNGCCRYSCMRSWWWVEVSPETCRAVSRYRCPTRYQTRHFFNNSNTNEDTATKFEQEYVSLCEKCDDIVTCAGSGHHLRPDRIEPGAPYWC